MSLAAIVAATLIALPIGVALGHTGRGGLLAINVSNLGRAIPSFALLVLLLLVLGLGAAPAFIALVALAVPPMVTNAYAGMRGVDRGLIDAARGLGMRERRILLEVELPNAVSVIMAGVRTAGVQVVATATLAALVAWGGLGRYIVDGLAQLDYVQVFAGAVLVALLAGVTELALSLLQRAVTPAGLRKVVPRGIGRMEAGAERRPETAG
ncbi:MAG: ABC transporter permease [Candidatus Dormibacteraeota bacterium]|nr:ABC transporter permease [Candidatus Dormibacteraeota bacterium]MBO0704440.1 ABC transporter permease [Candidatus Dormibacteraeota bacterium]MBO0760255.1 ABC transporter permease [Candidatus Dormibacteraeota bacterium]